METRSMKITKLECENFKRLTAISIAPDGSTVVIGGANGAGKSSTLDAIQAALGGVKHAPSEPVRHGAKTATIVLETEDMVVTRKFSTRGAPQLEVKAKDGSVYPSPQKLLDGLVGSLSFDPLAFSRLSPKEQAATLRNLVGLDFTLVDKKRQEAYDKRTEIGREVKRLQGALDTLPEVPKGTPDAEVSVAELAAEMERRQAVNTEHDRERTELEALRKRAMESLANIKRLEGQLKEEQERFESLGDAGKALSEKVRAHVFVDTEEVKQRIATAEQTNKAVRAKVQHTAIESELEGLISEVENLTEAIAAADRQKAQAAEEAQYPIEGLRLTDEGLTLNGVPFEQASSAEQLRASIAIGLTLNPKLKVLLIRDGSLLDAKSLELVAKMAADADAQVWLERVSTGDEVTVIIEDGQVQGAELTSDEPQPRKTRKLASVEKLEPGADG